MSAMGRMQIFARKGFPTIGRSRVKGLSYKGSPGAPWRMAESNIFAVIVTGARVPLAATDNFLHLKRIFADRKYGPLSPWEPAKPQKSAGFAGRHFCRCVAHVSPLCRPAKWGGYFPPQSSFARAIR